MCNLSNLGNQPMTVFSTKMDFFDSNRTADYVNYVDYVICRVTPKRTLRLINGNI